MRIKIGVAAGVVVVLVGAGSAGAATRHKHDDGLVRGLTAVSFASVPGPSAGPARSIGGYAAGCIAGAVVLPPEGTGYQVIRLSRHRNYAHPQMIAMLTELGRRVAERALGTMVVADVGQARGGPTTFAHASHMNGLDADIWLRLDLPELSRDAREQLAEINYIDYDQLRLRDDLWTPAQGELIHQAALDRRVERIFVHPLIKQALCRVGWADRSWLSKIRPWYGHDGHMHVRLACPADSPLCVRQKPVPDGDGCDDDLDGWVQAASHPVHDSRPEDATARQPALPVACRAVLRGMPVAPVNAAH